VWRSTLRFVSPYAIIGKGKIVAVIEAWKLNPDAELPFVQQEIQNRRHRFTRHAIQRMSKRGISDVEVEEATHSGQVIERYPHDKYGPSVLLCGNTLPGRILHVQWGLTLPVKVITVYEPDPGEWKQNFTVRKVRLS
jgi:hypothetical protein